MSSGLKIVKKQPRDYILYSVIIAAGIFLDQLTKWLSAKFLSKVVTVPIIKNVIHLTYVENRGAAFGMFKDHRWVFMITSTVMIVGLLIYLYLGFAENKLYEISIAMIISGGIGNMIDRIALKYVIDFIDFRLINFAVFNGADSFVCVGAGLLIFALLRDIVKEWKEAKAKKNNGGDAK
ncbi:MAG: signal peptidase II [Ruminococcaceae bacterium]|nr:signal peptidase II [Oscillospiraceae bacterium]